MPLTQDLTPAKIQVLPQLVLPPAQIHVLPPTQVLPPAQVQVMPLTQLLPPAQVQFQPHAQVLPVHTSIPFQRDYTGMLRLQHVSYLKMLSSIEEDNFEVNETYQRF
ncbi:hypothetical protein DPMN_137930 [Dreissena polymorpha]|uniref:Uncharacterized protein n=1 Tax=Dreissena polymorpha TaxID=45954 RepID=A0A9D4JJB0_DREPO|nr:hypothetical protein DPMN_137930 [Dreissena polymorpha]